MSLSGSVAIAGVYEHPTRWAPDKSEFQIMAECARGALEDSGLGLGDVDGLFGASMTMGIMGVVSLAEYLNIKPRFLDGTNIGGSSFVAHVSHAAAAIHAGLCDTALVLYGSTAASNAMAIGTGGAGGRDPNAAFVSPYGMTTVGSYALVAQLHQERYGTTSEQLAEIAVTMRRHAGRNPEAKMREPISVADVLESRLISDPLHLLDCCIISDGGGAKWVRRTCSPSPRASRAPRRWRWPASSTTPSTCARSTTRSRSRCWSLSRTSASASRGRAAPSWRGDASAWAARCR